jgi:O-antigen/teichoic acid export membrane protein
MIFNILFVLILDKGVLGYFYGGIISGILNLSVLTILMIKVTKIDFRFAHLVEPLKYSIPSIPSTILGNFAGQVDRFLLQRFVDLNTLGLYTVGLKFANLISQFHSALKLSYGPFMFKTISELKETGKIIVSKMTTVYLFPLFTLTLAISLFIDDYVIWTGQEAYVGIINIVPFLCYITLISCLYLYMAPGIILSKKTGLLVFPTLSQIIVLVAVGLLILPRFKIEGILLTKFLAGSVYLIVSLIISNRVSDWRAQYSSIFKFSFASVTILLIREFIPGSNSLLHFGIDIIFMAVFIIFGVILLKKSIR